MNLSRDSYFFIALIAHRALSAVRVVKSDGDRGSGDASLATLVHQVLQVACSNLWWTGECVCVCVGGGGGGVWVCVIIKGCIKL